jgi:hypothetical protein
MLVFAQANPGCNLIKKMNVETPSASFKPELQGPHR